MRIVVGASTFGAAGGSAVRMIENHNVELVKNPYGRKLTVEETIEHLKNADGLLAGLELLNEEVLSQSPDLKAIARIGIGTDNVDFEACERHNIKVSNTPDAPTEAVAEMALAALLSIAHQIPASNADMHNGVWNKRMGFSLKGLNILFIGYGRIGRKFAEHLKYLGSNIIVYDPYQPENSIQNLRDGLSQADVVTIHASGKDELFGAGEIDCVRDGAILLNCARGTLVNEDDICGALRTGKLSFYWADVYGEEPYKGKLIECDNAILTPHISTFSKQCRIRMEEEAVSNILRDLGIQ